MQSASSGIWTRVAVSISYDNSALISIPKGLNQVELEEW